MDFFRRVWVETWAQLRYGGPSHSPMTTQGQPNYLELLSLGIRMKPP